MKIDEIRFLNTLLESKDEDWRQTILNRLKDLKSDDKPHFAIAGKAKLKSVGNGNGNGDFIKNKNSKPNLMLNVASAISFDDSTSPRQTTSISPNVEVSSARLRFSTPVSSLEPNLTYTVDSSRTASSSSEDSSMISNQIKQFPNSSKQVDVGSTNALGPRNRRLSNTSLSSQDMELNHSNANQNHQDHPNSVYNTVDSVSNIFSKREDSSQSIDAFMLEPENGSSLFRFIPKKIRNFFLHYTALLFEKYPWFNTVIYRLPAIATTLVFELFVSYLIMTFSDTLKRNILMTSFLSLLSSISGNVGLQASASTVKKITLKTVTDKITNQVSYPSSTVIFDSKNNNSNENSTISTTKNKGKNIKYLPILGDEDILLSDLNESRDDTKSNKIISRRDSFRDNPRVLSFKSSRKIVAHEFRISIAVSIIVSLTVLLVAFIFSEFQISFAVVTASALFFAVSIAGLIGSAGPLLMATFGLDPTLTAGPFETAIQDIIMNSCYLVLAYYFLQ